MQKLTLQLYAYLGDLAEAQDVVHEAYYRALLKWKHISVYDDPGARVRRVAWNLATNPFRKQRNALNFLRRHSSGEETVAGPPSPERTGRRCRAPPPKDGN